uniref:Nucleic acid binding OB-fold tRNA/helicase-type protein (RFA1, RPA1, rpa) n=1 Tax=uncultured marine thaumarchaeote KM3_88_E12 TaxID=1456336 RepID=A0A075HUY3_9ARCH|nr:nucleic acid binding OB-fold tRNA/helicase-type protein (RFA1, RPA1, rpa) [uncultured marine thaumarchaeote KM3_88_E12]
MSKFEELLSKLLDTVPELSRSVIEDKIKEKKDKIGAGYLTDDGALFLIAADLGITLEQSKKMEIELKDLFVGAKEVTVESRILNMSPTKQFTKKDGTSFLLRTITVYDSDSTASVKLWDEKANLPGIENLKPGDLVKIIKAYVKSDLTGLPTINIGSGSTIEAVKSDSNIPSLDSITVDVSTAKEDQRDLVISGTVNGMINLMEFTNSRGQPSKALKFRIKGSSGNNLNVVLWGKDESILPKMIASNAKVRLLGVKTKTGNQGLEIHGNDATIVEIEGSKEIEPIIIRILGDRNNSSGDNTILGMDKSKNLFRITDASNQLASFVKDDILEFMPSKVFGNTIKLDQDSFIRKIEDENMPNISNLRTKISEIKEGNEYCVEAIILKAPEKREIQTKNGEQITLSEMFVEDDSGQIWIKGWRQQADLLDNYSLGDIISVLGVNAKAGLEGKIELFLKQYSKIEKKN